jgi:hypothetical protein
MSTPGTTRESGTHPVNIGHLVMGLAFAGLVGVWAAVQLDVVPTDDVRWLLPLPWLIAGAAGLVAVAFGQLRPRRGSDSTVAAGDDLTYDTTPDYTSDLDDRLTEEEENR